MESQAGDAQLRILLRKKYSAGCFHCKATNHTHHNCPSRPCYMCKRQGHLITACPFRLTPAVISAQRHVLRQQRTPNNRLHHFLRRREISSSIVPLPHLHTHDALRSARVAYLGRRIHSSRVTTADWLAGGIAVATADKSGSIRIWPVGHALTSASLDVSRLPLSAVELKPHMCSVHTITSDPTDHNSLYSSSTDGTIAHTIIDGDRASYTTLHDFSASNARRAWRMACALEYDPSRRVVYAADSCGDIIRLDPRATPGPLDTRDRFHRDKVTTINVNPARPNLLATASNDKYVCLWDARKFKADTPLGSYLHPRVVNSAFFSPCTGGKLLTTCIDNRLRLWSDINVLQGNAHESPIAKPLEIVHSHDFMRHINPFRAAWDPKDFREDTFICGRYLVEAFQHMDAPVPNMQQSLLHPVDIFSASTGGVVHTLVDSSISLICTINRFCPMADVVLSAASSNIYLWAAPPSSVSRSGGTDNEGNGIDSDNDDAGSDDQNTDLPDGQGRSSRPPKKRRLEIDGLRRSSRRKSKTASRS